MVRVYYGADGKGKLVRDKLADIIANEGHTSKISDLSPNEIANSILNKVPEELAEVKEAVASNDLQQELEELADLQTLIDSYIAVRKLDIKKINKIKAIKADRKGAFTTGKFIEYVDLNPRGDKYDYWLNYFKTSDGYIVEE